jgi:hypothetical protein
MKIKFVKQDCWVGLYWKANTVVHHNGWTYAAKTTITWYLCLVPCFPIIWTTTTTP